MKTKSIKIGHGAQSGSDEVVYKVISVKNSTSILPGQVLQKHEVEDLCRSAGWDVTIVPLREVA